MIEANAARAVEVAEWDWVCLPSWEKLHHARLIDDLESFDLWRQGEGETACGRRGYLYIPGFATRLGAERCRHCCRKIGFPDGKGSPKNDRACRSLVERRLRELP